MHSFLLIGQSNMAGRGYLKDAPEICSDRIYVLRNGRWQKMYRPVNGDRPFSGTNLAESFAEAYAKEHNVDVGLIPCADGGTSLNQWCEGSLLYDNAVYQSRLADRTSTIAGVLWHQGEADCPEETNRTYCERFTKVMNALRRDLDLYDVPFLLGGLGDFLKACPMDDNLKNYNRINDQLKMIAKENPMTDYVDAGGLTSNPDMLHFDAKSLYEFGKRYYEVFRKLEDKNKVFVKKGDMDSVIRTAMELL